MKRDMVDLMELLEKDKRMHEIFKECPYDILRSVRLCRYKENALYGLKQRVCQFLIDSADASYKMEITMRTEMLGSKLAVTQRSVNRVLRQLEEKKIIELSRGGAVIKNYEALLRERDLG